MTQTEFDKILPHIKAFISEVISNASLYDDKGKYVKESWGNLEKFLLTFELPDDVFRDLYVKYMSIIETKILKKK